MILLTWARKKLADLRRRERHGTSRDTEFWRGFADRFGLSFARGEDGTPRIDGRIEGISFTARAEGAPRDGRAHMTMTAQSRTDVTVVWPLRVVEHRWRTGDPVFDAACRASGRPEVVAASLDEPARARLAALISGNGSVERGRATLTLPWQVSEETARAAANLVFHAAFAIDHAPTERIARLLRIEAGERLPAVRARALWAARLLAPRDPEVQAALTRAVETPADPWMDLVGRLHGGDAGRLEELLADVEDPSLMTLAADLAPPAALARVLDGASRSEVPEMQRVVAEAALRADAHTRLRVLAALAVTTRRRRVVEEHASAMRALVMSCADLAGAELDDTMGRVAGHPWTPVSEAAIQALIQHGTIRAVPRLREEEARATRATAERLRSAIASIQIKAGPVDAGRVSLATDDGRGRMALADEGTDEDPA